MKDILDEEGLIAETKSVAEARRSDLMNDNMVVSTNAVGPDVPLPAAAIMKAILNR